AHRRGRVRRRLGRRPSHLSTFSPAGRPVAEARAVHRATTAAVAALAVVAVAAPAEAARRTRCTSSLTSAQTTVGRSVLLKGTLLPGRARAVRLQARRAGAWKSLGSTRSSRAGRFTLSVPASAAGTLRVRAFAPAAKGYRSGACAARVVTIATSTAGGGSTNSEAAAPAWRAVYALASDQTADAGKPAAIAGTIAAVDKWFATQTTGNVQPRWARDDGGAIAVTTVTLDHTAAQYAAGGDNFSMIAADLAAHDLPAPGGREKIAVYVDVTNSAACGATSGDVVLMFEAACEIHPGVADQWPYGATYLLAHEMTHGFGAVNACAPHAGGGGHVLDDPRDLLYAGSEARDWDHLALDPGHDDYYATGRSDCPGIESSPFWTATADPAS
ncbi:MAG: hypothetical protein JWM73_1748, partial [Solirubrobacterales bacterium]|nr:hypothetical protein [Solirubrobacterales bacterium]